MTNSIFIDTSALIALYVADDEFHHLAEADLRRMQEEGLKFITSNFILDEIFTFLRTRKNKEVAINFIEFLAENIDIIKIIRITVSDEKKAFAYFKKLDGKGVSFTDCTSFALMKRVGIKTAFTFDQDFSKAGFKIIP